MKYVSSYKPEQTKTTTRLVKPTDKVPKLLADLLSIPTPYGTEKKIEHLLPKHETARFDAFGNYIIDVDIKNSKTIFSCHMDTVHSPAMGDEKIHLMITDGHDKPELNGLIYGARKDKNGLIIPSVLGADDKVGVYLVSKMIEAKVPGRYIFHVGEERGCIGANKIVNETDWMVKGFNRAIAFDRANYFDIIHTQTPGRLISNIFEKALEKSLTDTLHKYTRMNKQEYKACHGIFTDTATYGKLVPECTNLSVGYFNQHGTEEHFDLFWVKILANIFPRVDWEALPTIREPVKAYAKTWDAYTSRSPTYLNNGRTPAKQEQTPSKGLVKDVPTTDLYAVAWNPVKDATPGVGLEKKITDWMLWSTDEEAITTIKYFLHNRDAQRAQIALLNQDVNRLQQEVFKLRKLLNDAKTEPAKTEYKLEDDPNHVPSSQDILCLEDAALAEALGADPEDAVVDIPAKLELDNVMTFLDTHLVKMEDKIKAMPKCKEPWARINVILNNATQPDIELRRLHRYILRCSEYLAELSKHLIDANMLSAEQRSDMKTVYDRVLKYIEDHKTEEGFEGLLKKGAK